MRLLAILIMLGLTALSGCTSSAPPVATGASPAQGASPVARTASPLPKLVTVHMQTTAGDIVFVAVDDAGQPIPV